MGMSGLQSMRDEFPEQGPGEEVALKCMQLRPKEKLTLN